MKSGHILARTGLLGGIILLFIYINGHLWRMEMVPGGAARWDPYREGHINPLDRVQKKAAKFAHHRNESNWESLT
jgi:hypothetical protein